MKAAICSTSSISRRRIGYRESKKLSSRGKVKWLGLRREDRRSGRLTINSLPEMWDASSSASIGATSMRLKEKLVHRTTVRYLQTE